MSVFHIFLPSKIRICRFIHCRALPFRFTECKQNLVHSKMIITREISQQHILRQNEKIYDERILSFCGKHHQYQSTIRKCHATPSCLSKHSGDHTLKPSEITETDYEHYVEKTLDSLTEFFEDLPESESCKQDFDCAYGNGVLTIHIGSAEGTYVINKQTPNKQIWLSSPVSGPKRYDYVDGQWVYLRDGKGLHKLLEEEMSELMGLKISLKKCKYYSQGTPDKI